MEAGLLCGKGIFCMLESLENEKGTSPYVSEISVWESPF